MGLTGRHVGGLSGSPAVMCSVAQAGGSGEKRVIGENVY